MQNRISLDDVAAGGALARLKLVGELADAYGAEGSPEAVLDRVPAPR